MRLTQKANKENEHLKMCIGWYELPTKDYHVRVINETPNQMYQKLGQLEDIEEELGIDLITYFKLFQTTKVWAYSNNGKWEITLTGVDTYDKMVNLWNGICHIKYPLSEYGKTWALTKEELL